MKVVALNGSPRSGGNTRQAIDTVCAELNKAGIETEVIQLGGKLLRGCAGCGACYKNKNNKCVFDDDAMNGIIAKTIDADGIIIGSPTYVSNVTTEVKAFIDRCVYVSRANGGFLTGKIGAPVVAARRAGANFVYSAINFFFGISEMPIATSSYWNMTLSRMPEDYQKDAEGIKTFETLGQNMAEMIKKYRA